MTDRICCRCKHWGYPHSDRSATSKFSEKCNKIGAEIYIDIDQGSGWDAGGASVEGIETNPSFGCLLFDVFVAESNTSDQRAGLPGSGGSAC